MNKRIRNKRIKQWIRSTARAVHVDTKLAQQRTGVNMSYHFIKDYVSYDINRLQQARKEMKDPVSLETYVRVLTMHELGHAIDREALLASFPRTLDIFRMKRTYAAAEQRQTTHLFAMLIEEHEMNIQFEETAWQHAEKMNEQFGIAEWKDFYNIKEQGLATYRSIYTKDLRLYQQLIKTTPDMTAIS